MKDEFVTPKLSDKKIAVSKAIKIIEERYGKGIITMLGDSCSQQIDTYSTGFLSLDLATGVGGIPRGRIIEIYGPEACGKTTLALHIIAEVQKKGGFAAYIDAEHAFNLQYAMNLGVNTDEVYFSQPDCAEQALSITNLIASSGGIDLIVIDSVAALVPKAELEGSSSVGLQALLMGRALRTISPVLSSTGCTIIFINQIRESIGGTYAEVTPGGRALKYFSTLRLELRRDDDSQHEIPESTGSRVKIRIAKNKVAPPFQHAKLDVIYGKGFSKYSAIMDPAIKQNIIEARTTSYSYNGVLLGRSRESALTYLEKHPQMCIEIENTVREVYGLPM